MFIVAQVLKAATALPLLPLVAASPLLVALVSALAPSIWEELTKWLPLKWWTKPTGWNAVLAFGIGYGGFECIYLAQQVLAVLIATAWGGLLAIEIPIGIVALLCYRYVRRTVQSEWGTADAAVAG